jgi:hypothetical protein
MKNALVAVFALHLIACSGTAVDRAGDGGPGAAGGGGGGGTGATGGTGGTGATGGSGGGAGTCGPGDQDCICPGGHFTCTNNRLTCVCPAQCTTSASCGQDALCYFYDGDCGHQSAGYCLSRADASQRPCAAKAVCGCDGTRYDTACAALTAGVSPNVAPTRACSTVALACNDWPSTASCNPTWYCLVNSGGGQTCSIVSGSCTSYNAAACSCETLPSGVIQLTCTI